MCFSFLLLRLFNAFVEMNFHFKYFWQLPFISKLFCNKTKLYFIISFVLPLFVIALSQGIFILEEDYIREIGTLHFLYYKSSLNFCCCNLYNLWKTRIFSWMLSLNLNLLLFIFLVLKSSKKCNQYFLQRDPLLCAYWRFDLPLSSQFVFLLYSICISFVILLYFYCISIVFLLYFFCISFVFLLYFYSISIVLLLYFYCIAILFLLYSLQRDPYVHIGDLICLYRHNLEPPHSKMHQLTFLSFSKSRATQISYFAQQLVVLLLFLVDKPHKVVHRYSATWDHS